MERFSNGGILVQDPGELPSVENANELFLDVETTAFDPKVMAFNPWKGHRICGYAFSVDNDPRSWYVPLRHNYFGNMLEAGLKHLKATISTARQWINHNIKFDAHFCAADGAMFSGQLVDTLTLAKIVHSDRFVYDLAALTTDWLKRTGKSKLDPVSVFCKAERTKDYADVPIDILGEYACQDIYDARDIYRYICANVPEQSRGVMETEIALTPVLFDMEQTGMVVNPQELKIQELLLSTRLLQIEEEIERASGHAIRPNTNADCFDLLCNQWGLPVLGYTDKGEPSFDKEVVWSYLSHPMVAENFLWTQTIKLIQEYRKKHTLLTMFIRPFQDYEVDGLMHSDYNQSVRTGRMSCRRPNAQQNCHESKLLIHAADGEGILCYDYSQIEFRFIVHYIKDPAALKAYAEDPMTDFHAWVAKMCRVPRRPAKCVNFGTAFGQGMNGLVRQLSCVPELIEEVSGFVEQAIQEKKVHPTRRQQAFEVLCNQRAQNVYNVYHQTFPTLRTTFTRAESTAKARGYVFNAYGRRRHLPMKAAHRAFPSIIQSSAADLMKERLVAVAPRYNSEVRATGLKPMACVHDEVAFRGPLEATKDPVVRTLVLKTLEAARCGIRVPIRADASWGDSDWASVAEIQVTR